MTARVFVALVALTACLFLAPSPSRAQPVSVSIFVQMGNTNADPLGQTLVYELREGLRRSSGFTLAPTATDSTARLTLLTLDTSCGSTKGVSTAASVLLVNTKEPRVVLMHEIHLVGKDRVADVAKMIIASIDEKITAIRNGK